jgi:hypothetical protein
LQGLAPGHQSVLVPKQLQVSKLVYHVESR